MEQLVNKELGEIAGSFIGEFSSPGEVSQFIKSKILGEGGTITNFGLFDDQDYISVDFKTLDGKAEHRGYFLYKK